MDKHQVVGVLRQMEKFLKGQEMRFTEGLRIMKSKLATLQNSVSKLPQADQSAGDQHSPHSCFYTPTIISSAYTLFVKDVKEREHDWIALMYTISI